MRKHRLADLRLVNVIGLPYEEAHEEACRWQHVMSEAVEAKVYELLGRRTRSPYGSPMPGLEQFDADVPADAGLDTERNLAFPGLSGKVVVRRICESVQTDATVLRQLHAAGVDPGATVNVAQDRDEVIVDQAGERIRLPREVASDLTPTFRPTRAWTPNATSPFPGCPARSSYGGSARAYRPMPRCFGSFTRRAWIRGRRSTWRRIVTR